MQCLIISIKPYYTFKKDYFDLSAKCNENSCLLHCPKWFQLDYLLLHCYLAHTSTRLPNFILFECDVVFSLKEIAIDNSGQTKQWKVEVIKCHPIK